MIVIQREIENEAYYLGSILQEGSLIEEATLEPKHFIKDEHSYLYEQLVKLRTDGETIDIIKLSQLSNSVLDKCGGFGYISSLATSVPSLNSFKTYEKSIKDYYTVKTANAYIKKFQNSISDGVDIKQLHKLIEKINKIDTEMIDDTSFKELLTQRFDYHMKSPKEGLSGVNTGFNNLNKLTDGWQPGDLIILGARPSMGKTAFALNTALRGMNKEPIHVTFFSLEMAYGQVIDRLLAILGEINLLKMRNPNKNFNDTDWAKHSKAFGKLEQYNLDLRNDRTVQEMRSVMRRNIRKNKMKHVVMIDFLTLIKASDNQSNRNQEVEQIVLDLKRMAVDLNIPVIVLSQLSRGVEQRQDKHPMMSDLRESGAIEQTADLIAFLYRDDYYNPNTEYQGITELSIAKNRNGPIGTLKFRFFKTFNGFEEE